MLVIRLKKGKQPRFKLKDKLKIGRGSGCHIQIDDGKASRSHAIVYRQANQTFLRDLGSSNGTYCNDERVEDDIQIYPGNIISIGKTEMVLEDVVEEYELVGSRLGGYRIMQVVGRGGMGVVFKANQLSMDRVVALKVLNKSLVERQDLVDAFVKEARAAGVLNHPNLIQVHDVGTETETYYFSMEFVEGATVSQILRREKAFSERLAIYVIKEVSKALEYAHGRGFVHRDIKPSNIMIDIDGNVKLADLGIAETLRNIQNREGPGKVMGTPEYMSPEQALGNDVDTRTDLYSLGATLYHMVSGMPPFKDNKTAHLIRKVATEPPPPLAHVAPDLSGNLVLLVESMMARNVEDRVPSATDVMTTIDESWHWSIEQDSARRKRLANFMKGSGEEARHLQHGTPRKPLSLKWLALAGGAIVVLAAAAAMLISSRQKSARPTPIVQESNAATLATVLMAKAYDDLGSYVRENPGELEIIAHRCNRFLEEFPNSPRANQIRTTMKQAREKSKERLYKEKLEHAYSGALAFAEENPDNLDGQWRLWRDFLAEYGNSPYADEAARNIEDVKNLMEARSTNKFKTILMEAETLASKGRYYAASTRLREFETGHYSSEIKKEAAARRSSYTKQYQSLFDRMKNTYDQALKAGRYGDATSACESFIKEAEAGKSVEQAKNMMKQARKRSNEEYAGAVVEVRNKLDGFNFIDAENMAEALIEKLNGSAQEKETEDLLARIRSLRKLHETAVDGIAAMEKPRQMPFSLERIGRGSINGATTERLSIDFGEIQQDLLWITFTKEQVLEIYQLYIDERYKDNKQLLTNFATEFKVEGKYYTP